MSRAVGARAVVLGGSMAGLLAARALVDHYPEVVLVERDLLPEGAEHRRGVPQSRHAHGVLARGQLALEELFPGLTDELVGRGAFLGDMLDSARTYFGGHRLRSAPADVVVLQASRPLLEAAVRARVRSLSSVRLVDGTEVVGLAFTAHGERVLGARVRRRVDGAVEEVLDAELVVDATGRGSRTPARVRALGYEEPAVEAVGVDLGYSTRVYQDSPGLLGKDLSIVVGPTPKHPRGATLIRIEGNRVLVTLYGLAGDHPPTDPSGFVEFAARLQFPDVRQVICHAQPLDDPVGFRYPDSVRHRYERLRLWPRGLLVVGDAVCSFNPVYGQGMSVAALEALALRRHLEGGREPEPAEFFREVARIVDVPWAMAAGNDLTFEGVRGQRTPQMRLLGRYVARLQARAERDARLARAFIRVVGLVDPPQTLFAPRTAARVLAPRGHHDRFDADRPRTSVSPARSAAPAGAPDRRPTRRLMTPAVHRRSYGGGYADAAGPAGRDRAVRRRGR
jgi:2-polyprenyl-6-methoxyphenol hydroxylase-like FAD-dependent oxidoreductase